LRRWLTGCLAVLVALTALLFGSAWLRIQALDAGELGAATPATPSRLLSRPLWLRIGEPLVPEALEAHLIATAHRRRSGEGIGLGEYAVRGREWRIGARAFDGPGGHRDGGSFTLRLSRDGRVASLRDARGRPQRERALEPAVIGRFAGPDGRDPLPLPLQALPDALIDAVLAAEDQRFFEHAGLDLVRIAGALAANLRAGRVVQGGSTLTQQLVKNRYLYRERTWLRKLQEAPIALLLEWRHGKREILEAYLNEVYLGQDGDVAIHGVGRAALHYFGKPAGDLAPHEAALLAGLLKGPSLYSPYRAPDAALARRNQVLDEMLAQGRIDPATHAGARERELGVVAPRRIPRSTRYFVDALTARLRRRFADEGLERGGFEIYTSLDLRLQRLAERAVSRGLARLERDMPALQRPDSPLQAALVALAPRSGELLALVGGRDYASTQFNRAVDAWRQPGSVFKPVAALAALGRESGAPPSHTLASLVDDEPLSLETEEGTWEPRNHDEAFRGPVTLRAAVEQSLNVPMVRLALELGPRRIVRAARRLGIESRLRGVPSLVLGTSEVTLLEMTRAYGVLAAEGWRAPARPLLGFRSAHTGVTRWQGPDGEQVIAPALAYLVTSTLEGVVNRGTGVGVRARGFVGAVAGKTGTTDEYRDAWFIGYTPDLVVGVWVGFDDGSTLRHSGSRAALPIFTDFLSGAVGAGGGRGFDLPDGIEAARVVAVAGHPAGLRCGGERELFLAGTAPVSGCDPWHWLAERSPLNSLGEWIGASRQRGGDRRRAPDVAAPPSDLPPWLRWLEIFERPR
jgi:penicillin-binding protein 1B